MSIFKSITSGLKSVAGPLVSAGASLLGGAISNNANKKAGQSNEAMQKEFAQKGIQWKVEDAKKAGIHPLYALGANTVSASPSYVGSNSMGNAMASAGQDIGRAITAKGTEQSRTLAKISIQQAETNLKGSIIDNQIKASQLQKLQQSPPALPSAMDNSTIQGQGDSKNAININPNDYNASVQGTPAQEAGISSSRGYIRTGKNTYFITRSKDAKERLEEDLMGGLGWNIKNRVIPALGEQLPPFKAPAGYHWTNNLLGEYTLKRKTTKYQR